MAVLRSKIDTGSPEFRANSEHHRALARDLRELTARLALGGDERSRERHASRGKLLPRERLEGLLDPGRSWRSACSAATNSTKTGHPAGASSPASAALRGNPAPSSSTMRRSRAAPITPSPSRSTFAPRSLRLKITCPASTSSIPVEVFCPFRTASFPTGTTSAASSTTRRTCPPTAFPRSPWSWGPAPPAGPTCPPCATRW